MVMGQNKYKLIIDNIDVNTYLVVKLNAKTTKEEASKEVGKIISAKNIFENYNWSIEGCEGGYTNNLNSDLQKQIIDKIKEGEELNYDINWDGMRKLFELELYGVTVNTNLETSLKSQTKAGALIEVNTMIKENKIFNDYDWNIKGCSEGRINELDANLQKQILDYLDKNIQDCIIFDSQIPNP